MQPAPPFAAADLEFLHSIAGPLATALRHSQATAFAAGRAIACQQTFWRRSGRWSCSARAMGNRVWKASIPARPAPSTPSFN